MSSEATEKEEVSSLIVLSTSVKQKLKRRRQATLYFRTRKSIRIKQGKPQISTKIPIEIEDSSTPRDKMPSPKSPIIYVRRSSMRSTSLQGKAILQDPQQNLQEAKLVLQYTLQKLQETQKLEGKVGEQQETKEEDPKTKEPSPQPNLDSYYQFIEGGRVIPQKFAIPLFFKLEKERARTH